MRMLRWMCGKTRKDKVRNEHIEETVGVAPIEDRDGLVMYNEDR